MSTYQPVATPNDNNTTDASPLSCYASPAYMQRAALFSPRTSGCRSSTMSTTTSPTLCYYGPISMSALLLAPHYRCSARTAVAVQEWPKGSGTPCMGRRGKVSGQPTWQRHHTMARRAHTRLPGGRGNFSKIYVASPTPILTY
jgi:hypothetical protein